MSSMLMIMNAALLAQGQPEILSQGEASDEYRVLSRNWPMIIDTELEDGNYNFAREHDDVFARQPGAYGFEHGYSVPGDALHVRDVFALSGSMDARRPIDWLQDGSNVYCNVPDGVSLEYTILPGVDLFSSTFRMGAQKKLEAIILRSLKEEYGAADRADAMAETYFQRARTSSSKSRSSGRMFRDPGRLTTARQAYSRRRG